MISENLYDRELEEWVEKVEDLIGQKSIVPIRISSFLFDGTAFAKLKGLPSNGQAIKNQSENEDKVFTDIVIEIKRVVAKMLNPQ